jgi:hypothetical protein
MGRGLVVAVAIALVASLLTACGAPAALPWNSIQTNRTVASTGKTVVPLGLGASVAIPPGSAPAGSTVSVSEVGAPSEWPSYEESLRSPVHLKVSTGNLTGPARISFPYDPATVPPGIDPGNFFGISTYDTTSAQWLVVPSTVDTTDHMITAEVNHFSWWNPFSWDFDDLFNDLSQDVLQTIGLRTAAPVCSGPEYPSYIRSVTTESAASDPLRSCSDVSSGILEVKMTSNRSYGMIMTYPVSVQWGWHASGGSILDKLLDATIDHFLPSNELYIPALQAASVGIPDTNFTNATFNARATLASMVPNIADMVIPALPGDTEVAKQAIVSCGNLLASFDAPVTAGSVLDDVNSVADCLTVAIKAAIASGVLSADDISQLSKSQATLLIFKNLKKLGTLVAAGVTIGATIGDAVLGSTIDNQLRQFSVYHSPTTFHGTPPTTPTPTTTTTTTTTEPAESAPTGNYSIGSSFSDECVVAWPTAPVINSNSIVMTMTCQNVSESEYLFTQVQYGDPNLNVTPDTGEMHVVGKVVDVDHSDYGYSELVVQASSITFG